jgi:polysaccharide export outer membrane protein
LAACGGGAANTPFVWVTEAPASTVDTGDLVIKEGDNLNVRVFGQDNLSSQLRVRLKSVLQVPSVSIAVEQPQQITVSVVGEVKNGGTFQLDQGATVLHALASAGGLSEFAGDDKIYVVRKGSNQRIRFKFVDLRGGEPKSMADPVEPP